MLILLLLLLKIRLYFLAISTANMGLELMILRLRTVCLPTKPARHPGKKKKASFKWIILCKFKITFNDIWQLNRSRLKKTVTILRDDLHGTTNYQGH